MADTVEAKSFLYAWLGKKNSVTPNYNIRAAGMEFLNNLIATIAGRMG